MATHHEIQYTDLSREDSSNAGECFDRSLWPIYKLKPNFKTYEHTLIAQCVSKHPANAIPTVYGGN